MGAVIAVSPIYESSAYGKTDQPAFLNAVVALKTPQNPLNLLSELKAIEKRLGRQRRERWGPREVDLDIIFYGQEVMSDDRLTIPHPDFHNRRFVLQPLCDIRPAWWSPVHQMSVSGLLEICRDTTKLTQFAKDW
ncbi:MAG: 2-amino-4-hydroxy-6-hydroxymethyldihydropteridine diphosphokinase [Calditrichia bacterium]